MANARLVADLSTLTRSEWLAVRRQGIGGSDASAVLGWNPWTSPWALYLDKVGELPDDVDEPHEAMVWGNRLEAIIAEAYAEETGQSLLDPKATYQHPVHDWMLASPDRLLADDDRDGVGLLEVKNVTGWKADEWADGNVPLHYLAQWQHTAAVMGIKWGAFAALVGGNQLVIRDMERSDEFVAMLTATEETFWRDHVLARVPPPIDGQESTEDLLKRMFDESDPDKAVVLDDDLVTELAKYRAASDEIKAAEERKKKAGNRIRAALEDAEEAYAPDGETRLVTYRTNPQTGFDLKALQAEMPEIARKYETKTTVRRLNPSRSKAAKALLANIDTEETPDGDH